MRRISASDIVITPDDRLGGGRGFNAPAVREDRDPAARPRPKRKPARLRLDLSRVQKFALIGVALTAVAMTALVVWRSGAPQRLVRDAGAAALNASADAGFKVSEITVSGRRRTPTDQIVAALGARHGEAILGLDLAAAKARVEALPSVRAAAIERRLPGAVHLSISERQPVALWQADGRFVLVDRDGRQIPGAIEGFEDLPLIVGEGAPQRVDDLFALLSIEPGFAARVKAATRVGNRRWTLKLDDVERGLEARLPEIDSEAAFRRLAQLEGNRGLTAKQITMVDLRIPERLVFKSEPQQAAERRPSSSDSRKED